MGQYPSRLNTSLHCRLFLFGLYLGFHKEAKFLLPTSAYTKETKPCFLIFSMKILFARGVDGPMPLPLKRAIALQAVFVGIDFFDLISEY